MTQIGLSCCRQLGYPTAYHLPSQPNRILKKNGIDCTFSLDYEYDVSNHIHSPASYSNSHNGFSPLPINPTMDLGSNIRIKVKDPNLSTTFDQNIRRVSTTFDTLRTVCNTHHDTINDILMVYHCLKHKTIVLITYVIVFSPSLIIRRYIYYEFVLV